MAAAKVEKTPLSPPIASPDEHSNLVLPPAPKALPGTLDDPWNAIPSRTVWRVLGLGMGLPCPHDCRGKMNPRSWRALTLLVLLFHVGPRDRGRAYFRLPIAFGLPFLRMTKAMTLRISSSSPRPDPLARSSSLLR
jgi:hypothetical protein